MPEELLPLFPLGVVLFPRTVLPLHIFEERYKTMISEVVESRTEFGVVLANEQGIVNTGCTARVEQVTKKYADGRMDIITSGRRRFVLYALDEQRPYLRGNVEFFEDEPDAEPAEQILIQSALTIYRRLRELQSDKNLEEPSPNDPQLSFQLAEAIPDLNFRQLLLTSRSEAERLKQIAGFLPHYVENEKRLAGFKKIVQTNGHSKHYKAEEE